MDQHPDWSNPVTEENNTVTDTALAPFYIGAPEDVEIPNQGAALEWAEAARTVQVKDAAGAEHAADVLAKLTAYHGKIEDDRKRMTGPILDHKAAIDSRYKRVTEPLAAAIKAVKDAIQTWTRAEQARVAAEQAAQAKRLRDEEAQRQREYEAKQQAAFVAGAPMPAPPPPVVAPTPPPDVARTVRGTYGGKATVADHWVLDGVENLLHVPYTYLTVDEAKVRQAIRDGVREIPGLRIVNKGSVRT